MGKLVQFEWRISRLYVDSSDVLQEDPTKIKLLKAMDLLRAAKLCTKTKDGKRLENQAWDALLPMQLEVNYSDGELFDSSGQTVVEVNDKNTTWGIWTEDESVGFNLIIRFQMEAIQNVTENNFDDWERNHGWDWIGVSIATEGYEGDSGSDMSHSFVEE